MLTCFTCNSISSFHVLMLCRKYKSTLKILLRKKKMGFVKIKKNIFSRTGLTGSLSPQRASRLFTLTLSYISVRRCAIPGVSSVEMLSPEELEEALKADPIMLLREITGISQQIFWYNTQPRYIYMYKYMYIPAALYTAHCTNAYSFPRGL